MKKYRFFLPLAFILLLSYWRHTYFLNINFNGDPLFIPVLSGADYGVTPTSLISIKSIITYWLLFLGGNMLFFSWSFSQKKMTIIAFFYFLITLASITFFAIDRFVFSDQVLYTAGSSIKNSLLSPIFTGTMYLMLKFIRS